MIDLFTAILIGPIFSFLVCVVMVAARKAEKREAEKRETEKRETPEDAYTYVLSELFNNSMFIGVYDAKNGNDEFMYGVATVMSCIAYKASKEIGDMYSIVFAGNMSNSREKAEAEGEVDD